MKIRVRHSGIAAVALLFSMCVMALAPLQAQAAPMVVILRADVDATSKATQYSIAPTMTYSTAISGFAADLSSLQQGMLAADPEVIMVAADQTRNFAPSTASVSRHKRKRGKNALTPIEELAQINSRGIRRIGVPEAPSAKIDNRNQKLNIDIAVLDSGIQADQPDLNVAGGVDCGDGSGWSDVEGHGTLVGGIAAAIDNAYGVVGVAPGARLWSVRVLDSNLNAEDSDVLCGIEWVTEHSSSIDVANMSLGGEGEDDGHCGTTNNDPIHYAICESVKQGVVYVAAAGNEGVRVNTTVPAAYSEVLAVSALADSDGAPGALGDAEPCNGYADDSFAPFSNWGNRVDLAAPGVCITSTFTGSDYAVDDGTSYASPFVAGAAALYMTSSAGRRDLRNVPANRRARTVIAKLRATREVTHLPGDPDHRDEGVLDVRGY